MKTITVKYFGGPDVLALVDAPDVDAGTGQVVVKVEAAGVGFVDIMARSGQYPTLNEPGFVPGLEIAGTIIAVGEGVGREMIDRRVYAMVGVGGYAEQVAVQATQAVPLPDHISCVDAVALGVNAAVAKLAMERAGTTAGDRVLVRGASGGIGMLAVQTAAAVGAKVTAVTSSAERATRVREFGAERIIDRTADGSMRDEFDIIFDPVGGADVSTYITNLAANGRYLLCGVVAGLPSPDFGGSLLAGFQKSLAFSTFSLNTVDPVRLISTFSDVFGSTTTGGLKPLVDARTPLSEAADAHRRLETGHVMGKLVLVP